MVWGYHAFHLLYRVTSHCCINFIIPNETTIYNLSTPPVGYADSPLREGADNASLFEGGGTLVPEGVLP